jgi:hypothetical protein
MSDLEAKIDAIGAQLEGLASVVRSLTEKVSRLEAAQGRGATKIDPGPPADDGFGRTYSTNALIDRMVTAVNPGRMMAEGRMTGAPADGKAWNDGGRR